MKWDNKDLIAKTLHKTHFGKDFFKDDIIRMDLCDLHHMIIHHQDFEDNPEFDDHKTLRSILDKWSEILPG